MRISLQYRVAFYSIGLVIGPASIAQAPPDVSGTYSFVEIDCVRSSGESYTVTIPGYTDQFVVAGQDFNETEVVPIRWKLTSKLILVRREKLRRIEPL